MHGGRPSWKEEPQKASAECSPKPSCDCGIRAGKACRREASLHLGDRIALYFAISRALPAASPRCAARCIVGLLILHLSLGRVDQLTLILVSAALLCPFSGQRIMPDLKFLPEFSILSAFQGDSPHQSWYQAGGPASLMRAHCCPPMLQFICHEPVCCLLLALNLSRESRSWATCLPALVANRSLMIFFCWVKVSCTHQVTARADRRSERCAGSMRISICDLLLSFYSEIGKGSEHLLWAFTRIGPHVFCAVQQKCSRNSRQDAGLSG
jgi:hypothetical protein